MKTDKDRFDELIIACQKCNRMTQYAKETPCKKCTGTAISYSRADVELMIFRCPDCKATFAERAEAYKRARPQRTQ